MENSLPSLSSDFCVLVVDDHPSTAATLARAIAQMEPGIEVLAANSGEQALELAQGKAVDLLVTDMMMPGMNGLELIEAIAAQPSGKPPFTILMTAYDVPGLKESARRLHVNQTLIKPFPPEHLRHIVRQALDAIRLSRPVAAPVNGQRRFKILVADDHTDNIELIFRNLQNENYILISAADGLETMEKVRAEMPDLVLLDVAMPGKDGFEVLQEIRSDPALAYISVIILTAVRLGRLDVETGLNLGADDYMTKPFDRRELLARIQTKLRAKESEETIRRRSQEVDLIPQIGRDLAGQSNLDELAAMIVRRSVEALGARDGHLVLLGAEPLRASYHLSSTPPPYLEAHLPPLETLMTMLGEDQQGTIIHDIHSDARWQGAGQVPARSVLLLPLMGRSERIGLLILAHEDPGYFHPDHQLLLRLIGSQAAIALEACGRFALPLHAALPEPALTGAFHALLVADPHARLTWLNPAGEKLFPGFQGRPGRLLQRGMGYDRLVELIAAAQSSHGTLAENLDWLDGRKMHARVVALDDGGVLVMMRAAAAPAGTA